MLKSAPDGNCIVKNHRRVPAKLNLPEKAELSVHALAGYPCFIGAKNTHIKIAALV